MNKAQLTILTYLKSLAEGIEKDAKKLKEKFPPDIDKFESKEISQLKRIIEDYNSLRSQLLSHSSEYPEIAKLPLPYISNDFLYSTTKTLKITLYYSDMGEAISTLNRIENICHALIDALEILLKPQIPSSITTKLSSLRKELEEMENKIEPEISNNIKEAIDEIEQGHNLAAALIASRVICYVLDKIQGKNDKEKAKKLIELGVIEKERKDEYENFLRASRLSRNFLSHKPSLYPKPEEALQIVISAFHLARYLIHLS
ncbi:MAG: hypothetical protein QW272_09910 [Candidatus Methanomethylicaceae archaeon]